MVIKRKVKTLLAIIKEGRWRELSYSVVLNLSPLLYTLKFHKILLDFIAKRLDCIFLGSHPHTKTSDFFVYKQTVNTVLMTNSTKYFVFSAWKFFLEIYGNKTKKVALCRNYALREDTYGLERLLSNRLSGSIPTVVWTSCPIYWLLEMINHKSNTDNRYCIGQFSWGKDRVEKQAQALYFLIGGSVDKPCIKCGIEEHRHHSMLSYCFGTSLLKNYAHLLGKSAGGGALFVDTREIKENPLETFAKIASFTKLPFDVGYFKDFLAKYTLELSNSFYSVFPYYLDFSTRDGFRYSGRMALLPYSFNTIGYRDSLPNVIIPRELYEEFLEFHNPNFVLVLTGKNQKENLEYFRCNPHKLRRFCELFSVFYNVAQQRIEELSQYDVSIQDILDYFKNNRDTYREFRDFLETEMCLIKQYAPEIVAQWAAYREFLEID